MQASNKQKHQNVTFSSLIKTVSSNAEDASPMANTSMLEEENIDLTPDINWTVDLEP